MSQHDERYQEFLRKLRTARIQAGLTQKQVADLLHKPQSYVSKSESGERRIDVIELAELAQLYTQPLEYFVDMN